MQGLGQARPNKYKSPTLVGGFFVVSASARRQSGTVQDSNSPLVRGSQRLGMSNKKDAADFLYHQSRKNEQKQGITMETMPCLLLLFSYIARFGSVAAYVRTWPVRTYAGKRAGSDI